MILLLKKKISQVIANQFVVDSFWSLAGNVVGKGLSLVAGIFVARYLGKDIFGEYGIIRNTILTIGIFSTFGLGYTATKFVADLKNFAPEKIPLFIKKANKITLYFSGGMALLLFVFADFVSKHIFYVDHLVNPLRILSVLIIFNAITSTQIGILSGFGKFTTLAKVNALIGVLTFLLSVLFTYLWNFNGAIFALLVVQIINCVINYFAVIESLPKSIVPIKKDEQMQKEILSFTTPIALQETVYSVTSWLGSVFIVQFSTFGELGMYSAAMQWNAILLFIPGVLRNVILSHLSSATDNSTRHNKILKQTIIINATATLIPFLIIVVFSSFIGSFYGKTFVGVSNLIILAVFSTVFTSVSNVYSQAYITKGISWQMLIFKTIRDVLTLLTFVFLVKYFNLRGSYSMILSTTFFSILFLVIIIYYYNKIKVYD